MLSVQPLTSAKGAADYYAAAFNYYAGDALAMRWLGKGSAQLGLSGGVEKEQMLALLQGKLPDGQVLQNKKGEHRPGFDMTFSAPKSVSILVGLGFDKELELFHDRAVERTISQLEEEFSETRIVRDGKVHFEKTNNFVIAAFRQPSSRANDPALHTHAVTMNMSFDKEGKARSLASDIHAKRGVVEQLQRHVTYCGLLYRTHLANMLKEKGYQLTDAGEGLFEIAGMPEAVLKEFSRRREDIEKYMKEQGWTGAKAASAATLLTRDSKEECDLAVLQDNWIKRVNEIGFDGGQFVKDALIPAKKGLFESLKEFVFGQFFKKDDLERVNAWEAVDVAIETVSQKSSVFAMRELKEHALEHSLTGNHIVGISAITQVIDEKIKSQSLYSGIDPQTMQPALTTPWLLTLEAESLARIESNKGSVLSITTKKNVIEHQETYESSARYPLTASQKQAMMQFLTSNDRYMAIQGYAGVGKTTMLKITRDIAESSGFELRGIAVTSSAALELQSKGGIKADVFPVVHGELLRTKTGFEKTIFIVDEASMLSSPQGHELIKLVEEKGARLYLVGDDAQLPSVKNGRIFGLSQEYGIETAHMVDNIRQKNEPLKEAVQHAIVGEVYDAVQKINEVREFKTHDERIAAIARSYLHLSSNVRENTLLFAPTHANRHEITALIREGLKEEGSIGKTDTVFSVLKTKALEEVQLYYAQYYTEGDVIRFNHDSKRLGITRGDYLTVGNVDRVNRRDNTLSLRHESGKTVTFKLNELPKYQSTRAGFKRHIEVYKPESLMLSEGDRVLWTRNFRQEGVINSERALVSSIHDNEVTFILDSGESKTFARNHSALKHLDHGYVFTNIKVQGKDKMYGMGLIESYNTFSATLRNFYVQISRSIYSMTLVTDDKNRLVRALEENDDTKKSAIEAVSAMKLTEHQNAFALHEKNINIDEIIGKKEIRDEAFQQRLTAVEQYRQAKESKSEAKSAKIAFDIVADSRFYRLSKIKLGYGEQVYRRDALKVATFRLAKSLSPEEREHFNAVKAYVRANLDTKEAWKQAMDIHPTPANKTHAFHQASIRNALAFKIAGNIESCRPWLKHYSIGELNRLGLSQHRYQGEETKALSRLEQLTSQAATHQVHANVKAFFSTPSEAKPALASDIKAHSKTAHSCLVRLAVEKNVPVDLLWKDINIAAKEHADMQFKQTLPKEAQKAFELIKSWRASGFELGKLWKESITHLEKGRPVPKEVEEKIAKTGVLRNEMAFILTQDKACQPALHYFKLDGEKLANQALKHEQRNNVLAFAASGSHFKNRLDAAELISLDVRGHYPFIKEIDVNTRQLNQYVRYVTRQSLYDTLSEAEIADYKKVLHYKHESRAATGAWKKIFALKEQSQKPSGHLLNTAMEATAKRDHLASQISNNPQYASLLVLEKIAPEKLDSHSNNHKARTREITSLNAERFKYLGRLEHMETDMSRKESSQWHTGWDRLSRQAGKVLHSEKLYQKNLKETPLKNPSDKQKELLEKYDMCASWSLKTNQTKSRVDNARHNIYLTVTNEALMANPEITYQAIFGVPKSMNSKEMRYSGGLIVSLKGSKSGLWFDFGSGEGGSPVQAIMRERGVGFKEALSVAAEMAGTKNMDTFMPVKERVQQSLQEKKREIKNKIISAQSILKGCVPLKNTLAERYLKEHRSITNPEQINASFWPKNAKWMNLDDKGNLVEKINKIPALVIAVRNDKGETTGVQRIYLDEKTGNKNTLMEQPKISRGHIQGSAGIIQEGVVFGRVYVAEGPETGASIAMADPKATVLVSLGLSNIQNLGKLIKCYSPIEVIIAGDNDRQPKSMTFELTQKAQESLKHQGIDAEIIMPQPMTGFEKTDWNDVLKGYGVSEVKKQLGIDIPTQIGMSISQKEMENIIGCHQDNEAKKIAGFSGSLKESYVSIHEKEGRASPSIDKEIQTKITDYTKNNSIQKTPNAIDSMAFQNKEISLEI